MLKNAPIAAATAMTIRVSRIVYSRVGQVTRRNS